MVLHSSDLLSPVIGWLYLAFFWLIRRLQHEKEEWSRQLDTREKEVSSLKDNIQGLLHRITNLENKLNLTENEVRLNLTENGV